MYVSCGLPEKQPKAIRLHWKWRRDIWPFEFHTFFQFLGRCRDTPRPCYRLMLCAGVDIKNRNTANAPENTLTWINKKSLFGAVKCGKCNNIKYPQRKSRVVNSKRWSTCLDWSGKWCDAFSVLCGLKALSDWLDNKCQYQTDKKKSTNEISGNAINLGTKMHCGVITLRTSLILKWTVLYTLSFLNVVSLAL